MTPLPTDATVLRRAGAAMLFVLAASGAICAAFAPQIVTTWIGFFFIAATPPQIVLALLWRANHPEFVGRLPQPQKGITFLGLNILSGAGVGGLLLYFGSTGGGPPTPMLLMLTIVAVPATIWVVAVWHCWPISILTKNRTILGGATLVFSYAVAIALFGVLFNFSFLAQAPFYVEAFDPKGLFNAWSALSFIVTTITVALTLLVFDFWPLSAWIQTRHQPVFGAASSVLILTGSGLVYGFSTGVLGLNPVQHLAQVAVPMIFGVFIVETMTRHQLFLRWQQPRRGLALAIMAACLGAVMFVLYSATAALLQGRPVPNEPPAFELYIWIANAMLGITFPLMIVAAEFFELWPIQSGNEQN